MNRYILYFLIILPIFTLLSCQKSKPNKLAVDNKSYIKKFELIQKNASNKTTIKITSPKAIIDPLNNNIEVIDSSIEILNKKGDNLKVESGKSIFNNSKNLLNVYNNVYISLLDHKNSFIKTNSFDWDLNTSNINLYSPLDINFENSRITSSYGSYNIDSSQLNLSNNVFNTSIQNSEGNQLYQIEIISDKSKWFKYNNSLEFASTEKQVETTINLLRIK